MRKILFILIFVCTYEFFHNATLANDSNMLIRTVDKDKNVLKAQIFKWWYSNDSENKHLLECAEEACSEWIIREEISGPVILYAQATIVKENDQFCWNGYEGTMEIEANANLQQEFFLKLFYSNTVCK